MLLPQFSLRWLLACTTVLALVSLLISEAIGGTLWAIGVVAGLAICVATLLLHALFFWFLWLFSLLLAARRRRQADAPLATAPLPGSSP